MTKQKNILITLIICLSIVSCDGVIDPLPYGKWENTELNLILDIDPKKVDLLLGDYPGIYQIDGDIIDIDILFAQGHFKEFFIYRNADIKYINEPNYYKRAIFSGTYRLGDKKLVYTLQPLWVERTGIKTIVFEKVEDYEIPSTSTS